MYGIFFIQAQPHQILVLFNGNLNITRAGKNFKLAIISSVQMSTHTGTKDLWCSSSVRQRLLSQNTIILLYKLIICGLEIMYMQDWLNGGIYIESTSHS